MSDYGVTKNGFVLKRLDRILDEIHTDLTSGFGVNTRTHESTFLNCLVTTFGNQIAELWEVGQENYYAKYPATASGVSLDNAVQYSGIRRKPKTKTIYPLNCVGIDGTNVSEGTVVATKTNPQIRLKAIQSFKISRDNCKNIDIKLALVEKGIYTITINESKYTFVSKNGIKKEILEGLKNAIKDDNVKVSLNDEILRIEDVVVSHQNRIILSENLTTKNVTTLANFETVDYGRIFIPSGLVTKIITNTPGFISVINECEPVYGRDRQTDVELRHDYLKKFAIHSNTMIESIVAEILNNVPNVQMACGYENDLNETDSRGLPPHSIEIIVDGGNDEGIAKAILKRKAGGIQTYGNTSVSVPGFFGDNIDVKFNRPENIYVWLRIVLHKDAKQIKQNYTNAVVNELINIYGNINAGENLFIQKLSSSLYEIVSGLTFVDITSATSNDINFSPKDSDFKGGNVYATKRQKLKLDNKRVEVKFVNDI